MTGLNGQSLGRYQNLEQFGGPYPLPPYGDLRRGPSAGMLTLRVRGREGWHGCNLSESKKEHA